MTPQNTIIRKEGGVRCRACKNERAERDYWAKADREGRQRVRPRVTTLDSLYANSHVDASGCRIWNGKPTKRGYARTKLNSKPWLVHRLIWELEIGPITPGMTIGHKCHDLSDCTLRDSCPHRMCFEITHLAEEPIGVNTLAGKTIPAMWAARTAQGLAPISLSKALDDWRAL